MKKWVLLTTILGVVFLCAQIIWAAEGDPVLIDSNEGINTPQSATQAGVWRGYELSGGGSNYRGIEAPDAITDSWVIKLTDTNPAGSVMVIAAPAAGEAAQTWREIVLTVGDPGSDSNIPTEQGVREALDLKAPLASPTFTGTVTIPTPFTLGAVSVLPTGTELNFVDGVTSAIQAQLDARCLESVFGTSIGTGLLLDGTVLKASAILQEYHAVDPTAAGLALLDDADAAAQRTTLGVPATTEIPGMTSTTPEVIFCFNLHDPDDTMDYIKKQFPRAMTITKVTMKCDGGTNVVGRLYEVDGDGDGSDQVGIETADWTVTTTETEDTSFNNATLDAGDYLSWDTTSVSGAVVNYVITVEGYET